MSLFKHLLLFSFVLLLSRLPSQVIFCQGTGVATIIGYSGAQSYTWTTPLASPLPASQVSLSTITFTNGIVGSIYTLQVTAWNNSVYTYTYNLAYTQVTIAGIGSSPSCSLGSSGSATVQGNGSYSGYTYTWVNSGNSFVGSASIASSLPTGNYTVFVSATGSLGCGTASASVNVGVNNALTEIQIYKPYCGNEAYLCAGAGSNFQWYNNFTPIAPPAGTAPCYTVNNPVNGAVYRLKYFSAQGCNDSIKFTLGASMPGSVGVQTSSYACQGSSNGSVVISMTPAPGAPPGQLTFSVSSTGSLNPNYSASLAAGFQSSLGLTNLSAGTYSIFAFDGSCKYLSSFSILNFPDNFTLSPNSVTLCAGQLTTAGITFTSPPSQGQYTYSWSPGSFLAGYTQQSTIIFANTPPPGLLNTIVYTVVVTPSLINCPMSKTMSVSWANPATPSVTPIPVLCQNSSGYTINAIPAGGTFSTSLVNGQYPIGSSSGIISTTLAPIGLNTFTYTAGFGTCVATSSFSYQVSGPQLTLSPFVNLCSIQSVTLQASGANSYTWSNGSFNYSTVVSPSVTTTYSVTGSISGSSCTSIKSTTVYLLPLPNINISGNQTICNFQSTTLTASGASSYIWNNGTASPSCVVQPSTSTVYSVFGTSSAGCTNSTNILVNVNYGPMVQIKSTTLVCTGEAFTIAASGANSYTWSWSQGSNSPSMTLVQGATTVYSLSASSFSNPCVSQMQFTVFTDPCLKLNETQTEKTNTQIFPNPNAGRFTLYCSENAEMILYNELGQFIIKQNISPGSNEIDPGIQNKGLYFVQLRTSENIRVLKFVVD